MLAGNDSFNTTFNTSHQVCQASCQYLGTCVEAPIKLDLMSIGPRLESSTSSSIVSLN